jgi:hypothetical protein
MGFAAVLCHFCENEGPTVLLTTVVDGNLRRRDEVDETAILEGLHSLPDVDIAVEAAKADCRYCHSLTEQEPI